MRFFRKHIRRCSAKWLYSPRLWSRGKPANNKAPSELRERVFCRRRLRPCRLCLGRRHHGSIARPSARLRHLPIAARGGGRCECKSSWPYVLSRQGEPYARFAQSAYCQARHNRGQSGLSYLPSAQIRRVGHHWGHRQNVAPCSCRVFRRLRRFLTSI